METCCPWRESVAVVIPAYNESSVIGPVVEELRRESPWATIIVVDDASDDSTASIAENAGALVLRHAVNRGQGAALQTGLDAAQRIGADVAVTFDADGQHEARDVRRLVEALLSSNAEVALASRFLSHNEIPLVRRLVLRLAVVFTRVVSGIAVTDTHNGLKAIRTRVLPALRMQEDRMAHASELLDLLAIARLKFLEVPCTMRYSEYSVAKGQRSSAAPRVALSFLLGKLMR